MRISLHFAVAVVLLAVPLGALAATESFHADIVAVDGTGSTATGTATLQLDADRGEVTYEITISGLGSAEIGAHIHDAQGNILHHLPSGPVKNGVWSGLGLGAVFQMRGEQLFILVHTQENPGGEVRGDILAGTVPIGAASVGRLKQRY